MLIAFGIAIATVALIVHMATDSHIIPPPRNAPGLRPSQGMPTSIRAFGGLAANVSLTGTTATVIWESDDIDNNFLTVWQNFLIKLGGVIGGDGAADATLVLAWVKADGTATTLLTFTLTNPANEATKALMIEIQGRVVQEGATGEIFAVGKMEEGFGTAVVLYAVTALLGVTVDLTQPGRFRLTHTWNAAAAQASISLATAICSLSAAPQG